MKRVVSYRTACALVMSLALSSGASAMDFGAEQIVQAGGADLTVGRFAMPIFQDWNSDGLPDLIVGEGVFVGSSSLGKVRVYLNGGTPGAPAYSGWSYAQAAGSDLQVDSLGCVTAGPRIVDWDADGRKDLIVSRSDGRATLFLNSNTDASPAFDAGTFIQVGLAGAKVDLDVGARSAVDVVDWNNDGLWDLVFGDQGSRIRIYLNEGLAGSPDFQDVLFAQDGAGDLYVPGGRSVPSVFDWDGDGKKDLLSGNTGGELYLYSNVATDASPAFNGGVMCTSLGTVIDIDVGIVDSVRSRPFVCDWNNDGLMDVLVGAGDGTDGKAYLYLGVPEPATLSLFGIAGLGLLRRRRR